MLALISAERGQPWLLLPASVLLLVPLAAELLALRNVTLPPELQNQRPRDFFGPEDWTGGDPDEDVRYVRGEQERWDRARAGLNRRQRLLYFLRRKF